MSAIETEQRWSSDIYANNARFVSELGAGVLDWLAPQPGERVIDVGCGDGHLTRRIKGTGADVVGVDTSECFVGTARAAGLDARVMSGEALTFQQEFDAAFSNAALHWMTDGEAVVRGVHRALKNGGRFVGEFGGHGNVAAIRAALMALARKHDIDETLADPWFFPTADEYRTMLEENGFAVERAVLIPRPTPLPTGLLGWIETFREPFFHAAQERAQAIKEELEALLAPVLRDKRGKWTADYVRLRFIAHKV